MFSLFSFSIIIRENSQKLDYFTITVKWASVRFIKIYVSASLHPKESPGGREVTFIVMRGRGVGESTEN